MEAGARVAKQGTWRSGSCRGRRHEHGEQDAGDERPESGIHRTDADAVVTGGDEAGAGELGDGDELQSTQARSLALKHGAARSASGGALGA
jgi:hypothetical protein